MPLLWFQTSCQWFLTSPLSIISYLYPLNGSYILPLTCQVIMLPLICQRFHTCILSMVHVSSDLSKAPCLYLLNGAFPLVCQRFHACTFSMVHVSFDLSKVWYLYVYPLNGSCYLWSIKGTIPIPYQWFITSHLSKVSYLYPLNGSLPLV